MKNVEVWNGMSSQVCRARVSLGGCDGHLRFLTHWEAMFGSLALASIQAAHQIQSGLVKTHGCLSQLQSWVRISYGETQDPISSLDFKHSLELKDIQNTVSRNCEWARSEQQQHLDLSLLKLPSHPIRKVKTLHPYLLCLNALIKHSVFWHYLFFGQVTFLPMFTGWYLFPAQPPWHLFGLLRSEECLRSFLQLC